MAGLEVLDDGRRIRSVRTDHFLELVNFGGMSTNRSRDVESNRSAPLIPARLTTWMYRIPVTTEWLTLKVIRTLISPRAVSVDLGDHPSVHVLVLDAFFDPDWVRICQGIEILEIDTNLLARWECRRVEFQG